MLAQPIGVMVSARLSCLRAILHGRPERAAATARAARDAADEVRPALLAGEVSFWHL